MPELWRPVPDAPGYEASDLGRVRSLRRATPRVLTSTVGPCGFPTVNVSALVGGGTCRRVGTMVAAAWLGPLPEGAEVRRLDGDPLNDRLENLAYGTAQEVAADHAARARREEAAGAPTHCPDGHRYTDSWLGNWGARYCRDCQVKRQKREYNRRYYATHYRARKPLYTQCVDCGIDVQQNAGSGQPFKRCPDCRTRAQAEYQRRYRAKATKPPRISHCIDCGVRITNQGPGPLATRCTPHKALARRDAWRRHEQKRRAA